MPLWGSRSSKVQPVYQPKQKTWVVSFVVYAKGKNNGERKNRSFSHADVENVSELLHYMQTTLGAERGISSIDMGAFPRVSFSFTTSDYDTPQELLKEVRRFDIMDIDAEVVNGRRVLHLNASTLLEFDRSSVMVQEI